MVWRKYPKLTGFVSVYYLAFIGYGYLNNSSSILQYALIMLLLISLIIWLEARIKLSKGVLWALGIWGLLHMAGGLVELPSGGVLYNLPLWVNPLTYDRLVHAYGFGVTAVALWRLLEPKFAAASRVLVAIAILASSGIGAINEIFEFWASQLWPTNVGDYLNTSWDLVFNLIGATAATLWLYRQETTRP